MVFQFFSRQALFSRKPSFWSHRQAFANPKKPSIFKIASFSMIWDVKLAKYKPIRSCNSFFKSQNYLLFYLIIDKISWLLLKKVLAPTKKHFHVNNMNTVKPVLNGHSKRRLKIDFQDLLSLNAGKKYWRMLQESILQYFWPTLSKTFVLSIFCLF